MSNLVEQWSDYLSKGNQLCNKLKDFEIIIQVINQPDTRVTLYQNDQSTFIDYVLPENVIDNIKQGILLHLKNHQEKKEAELKELMGMPNLISETKDNKSMDKHPVKKSKQGNCLENMTVEEVKRLYINEGKNRGEIADIFGVTKVQVNNFLYRHKIRKEKKKKQPDDKECP